MQAEKEEMWSDALDHTSPLHQTLATNNTVDAEPRFPIPSPSPASSPPPPSSSSPPDDDGYDETSAVKNEDMEIKEESDSRDQTLPVKSSSKDNNNDNDNDLEETEDSDEGGSAHKKQKTLSSLPDSTPPPARPSEATAITGQQSQSQSGASKKSSKKKNNNVWTKSTSRKGKKKSKSTTVTRNSTVAPEDNVFVTPIPRFPDKSDDSPDAVICLSRAYKAEKVELSDDRLSAGSTKGYRMVRATRGVEDGAWYFEIKVVKLGETGHTRLGWTTEKGDLQAPVGYDGHSFGYRDIDGSKIHKALREKYGEEGYLEGDVIGVYINLPDGKLYASKPPNLVWYKGQRYMYPADGKDEPPKIVPGSEISFFKNGICQGVAFTDLFGSRYYPAASMYTLPNQPNCEVRFNFGPDFEFFPQEFGSRPIPRPMSEVTYHGYDGRAEGAAENGLTEKNN